MESKGVKFVFSNPPKEFVGVDGSLTEVVLADGTRLPAQLCVVGTGEGSRASAAMPVILLLILLL